MPYLLIHFPCLKTSIPLFPFSFPLHCHPISSSAWFCAKIYNVIKKGH